MGILVRQRKSLALNGLPHPADCDFVAIDFETANETRGSACALGVALVRAGEVVREGSTLINPETYFNPYCTAINGIDPEDVESAPNMLDLWPTITALLDGQQVVAHNASFDISVLRNSAARYGVEGGPSFNLYCTYRLARRAWPDLPSYSLGYVAPKVGVSFKHHEAGADARACAMVALAISRDHDGLAEAASSLSFSPGLVTSDAYKPGAFSVYGSGKPKSTPGNAGADPSHPLYGKTICFTGGLQSMIRSDAVSRVTEVGCSFKPNVSKKVNFLVIGDADFVDFADGWRTGKLEKAMTLRDAGAPIEIISENDFLAMLLS